MWPNMTISGAQRLQKMFTANYGSTICTHRDLVDPLYSIKGQDLGLWVCLACGVLFKDQDQPLSSAELETLEKDVAKDG